MGKLVISDSSFKGGKTGINVEDQNAHIEINRSSFSDLEQDITAPNGMRRLDIKDSGFAAPQEDDEAGRPRNFVRKLFGGFSFAKGDHLK